jgi:hypothetical protein
VAARLLAAVGDGLSAGPVFRPAGQILGSGSVPAVTFKGLCVDAAEAARVARFWAVVLTLDVEIMDGGDAVLRHDGRATIWVNGVPEGNEFCAFTPPPEDAA